MDSRKREASWGKNKGERIVYAVGAAGGEKGRTGCALWHLRYSRRGTGNEQSWVQVLILPLLAVCPRTHDPLNKSQLLPRK